MRFVRQPLTIRVMNYDDRLRSMGGDNAEKRKHGTMLPNTIRAIICGPSNCGKTNVLISLLESPHGVCFENVYVYSKSLQQPKYQYLEKLLTSIDEIDYFTFSNNSDVIPPMVPAFKKGSPVWHFFIKNSTGGTCKICSTDVKSGGSGGNTTNLKNHLVRKHPGNPDIKQMFIKDAKLTAENAETVNMQRTNKLVNSTDDNQTACSTSRTPTSISSMPAMPSSALILSIPSPASTVMELDSMTSRSNVSSPTASMNSIESELSGRLSSNKTSRLQPRIDNTFKQMKSFEGGSKAGEITNAILFMLAKDNMPFNTVKKEGFKYLIKTTVPLYNVPGRKSITKYMEEKYNYLSSVTKDRLNTTQHISLTSDLWTDVLNTVSYLEMTAHYAFEDELRSTTIGVTEVTERHTAEVLGRWIENIMDDWNIDKDNVVVMVTDNGSNIVKAVHDTLGSNKHLPCFAHTLNLVATHTMDFDDATVLVTKIKTIVTFFKQSSIAANELRKISALKLTQCVDTRWNSIYYMLERFIMLADTVGSILLKMPSSPPMLTAAELLLAKEVLEVLRPIEQMTKELCGEKYVTISKMIPMIYCLKKEIESLCMRLQTLTARTLIDRLQKQIVKRFGHITNNRIIAVSTILDPRFNRLHFQQNERVACAQSVNFIAKCMREIDRTNTSNDNAIITEPNVEKLETSNNLWMYHKDLVKGQIANDEERNQNEMPTNLRHYLNQPLAQLEENPMFYWSKQYKMMYPTLSEVAKKYLPVVATSVPSERLFSRAGNILTEDRNRLSPDHLQQLLFLNSLTAEEWQLKD
ncbi:PREDICTED: zinc finger BED domain-containing protein 4-like [Vollenhovia emeryi]|uniref:zinc finger BED domain-containing protein 4-like n=1 Tax=Vollenhovia emeryi TaxID=411798 RepID=UPI0005F53D73|nr:PREDICTED: zinc finger BED domain-containing protein 4-like [Vollenhovia emeryi]